MSLNESTGMMSDHLKKAEALIRKLEELSKENASVDGRGGSRSGDEVATEQFAVFGDLLVVLAHHLDGAQQTVKRLTWILTILTVFLVLEALWRAIGHFSN